MRKRPRIRPSSAAMPQSQRPRQTEARSPKAPDRAANTPPLSPRPGRWLWTCRAGFEDFLCHELGRNGLKPRPLGAGAVECDRSDFVPVFGRAGFRVTEQLGTRGKVEGWTLDTP